MSSYFFRTIVILLLFPFYSYTQEILSGKVVEASTGNAIPYATIGLVKQNAGTNANEKGEFIISSKQPELDSLIISCIGYKTILLPVTDLRLNPVLTLSVNEKRLRTVVIRNKWTTSKVGDYSGYKDYCFTSTGYQSQVARKITAPFANTSLHTIHIRSSKNGGKSIFRIRVYDFDSVTKGPGEELTDTLVQVTSKTGINTIDMSPYQIMLPGKDFFISIEWILIPYNEKRFTATFEGKEQEQLHYNPCICFTKDASSNPMEAWGLSYSGWWHPQKHHYSLAISAEVKY